MRVLEFPGDRRRVCWMPVEASYAPANSQLPTPTLPTSAPRPSNIWVLDVFPEGGL